jgi:hypothetical protein
MNTYPVTHEKKDQELKTIWEIHYHKWIIHPKQKHNLSTNNSQGIQKSKWATYTYYGPDTRSITKISITDIKIAFKTTITIKNHLNPREKAVDTYNQNGVYQLNECWLCGGQMERMFKVWYKEHIQAIRTNKQNSKYAHTFSMQDTHSTIDQTLEILQIEKKGQSLNTLECFHVYNLSKHKLHMNDTFTDISTVQLHAVEL